MIGETRGRVRSGKPLDSLDDSQRAGPVHSICLVRRRCLACGEEETDDNRRPLYWPPLRTPHDTRCSRCGSKSLVPGDLTTFYYRMGASLDMRQFHKTGRPAKEWLAQLEADRLAREANWQ